jgi:hypothetical protein
MSDLCSSDGFKFSLTATHLPWIQTKVVVVSGEQGRKDFFGANGLDVKEGFRLYFGQVSILGHPSRPTPIRTDFRPSSPSSMA